MIDDNKRAEIDQASAWLAECLPPLWWSLFEGCLQAGFTESNAIDLVKTYIVANNAIGFRAP